MNMFSGIWFTLCLKNDTSLLMKAVELHDILVDQMQDHIKDGDFKTQCVFQPLPLAFIKRSSELGGNVLGPEQHKSDGVIWGFHVMVRTPELELWAFPRVRRVHDDLRHFAQSNEGLLDWTTANYAHPTQEVFRNYGKKNVEKIREVAARYDPEGVFQHLCPGGFKISAVKD